MALLALSNAADLSKALTHPYVLLDFWAPWCGPCKQMHPVLEQLARSNPHISVITVNVDDLPEIAARYNIRALPSLVFIRDGTPLTTKIGAAPLSTLSALADQYLARP